MGPEDIFLSIRKVSWYRFVCPQCGLAVEKTADRKVVALLLSAGVNLGDGKPAVPSIRPECRDLPPFDRHDVLAFHRLLRDDDFLAELAGEA